MRRAAIITIAVAVLGIIGAVSAFALSSRIGASGGHGGSEPAQPDRAIARDIENAVRHQPGCGEFARRHEGELHRRLPGP